MSPPSRIVTAMFVGFLLIAGSAGPALAVSVAGASTETTADAPHSPDPTRCRPHDRNCDGNHCRPHDRNCGGNHCRPHDRNCDGNHCRPHDRNCDGNHCRPRDRNCSRAVTSPRS
ncbi:MAG: hypothetical protein JWM47_2665 [Acidimicrobiales bacterium]|nr:hypothetical protein [Acidimicrobiales bacterium]